MIKKVEISTVEQRDALVKELNALRLMEKCESENWYWANERALKEKSFLFYYLEDKKGVGFNWAKEYSNSLHSDNDCQMGIKATQEEVNEAFKAEAKRRYKVGQTFLCVSDDEDEGIISEELLNNIKVTTSCSTEVDIYFEGIGCYLMDDGEWAEIKKEPIKLVKNRFYKVEGGILKYNNGLSAIGFINGDFGTGWTFSAQANQNGFVEREATSEEIKEAFLNEVKKRGYTKDNFESIYGTGKDIFDGNYTIQISSLGVRIFSVAECKNGGRVVYELGTWAKIKEKTYKIGQRFQNIGLLKGVFILAVTGDRQVGLINLETGTHWNSASVKSYGAITQKEFNKITKRDEGVFIQVK